MRSLRLSLHMKWGPEPARFSLLGRYAAERTSHATTTAIKPRVLPLLPGSYRVMHCRKPRDETKTCHAIELGLATMWVCGFFFFITYGIHCRAGKHCIRIAR